MKIDAMLGSMYPHQAAGLAKRMEDIGFDAVWSFEAGHDPFLPLAVAAMLKVVGPEKRSIVLGLGMASGSLGMVAFSPITQALIANLGWYDALVIIAISTIIIIPLALLLPNNPNVHEGQEREQTVVGAIREATRHRSFVLLTSGFFVCGFHVTFINVHFPAYITDLGLDPSANILRVAAVSFLYPCDPGLFTSGYQDDSMHFRMAVRLEQKGRFIDYDLIAGIF